MVEFQVISHLVEGDNCWVCGASDGKVPWPLKLLAGEGTYLFCLFVIWVPF